MHWSDTHESDQSPNTNKQTKPKHFLLLGWMSAMLNTPAGPFGPLHSAQRLSSHDPKPGVNRRYLGQRCAAVQTGGTAAR